MADSNNNLVLGNVLMWAFTLLYTASPIDVIPDFIPVLGQADDAMGWLASIAVTVYTAYRLQQRKKAEALEGAEPSASVTSANPVVEDSYQPWSLEQIRDL